MSAPWLVLCVIIGVLIGEGIWQLLIEPLLRKRS